MNFYLPAIFSFLVAAAGFFYFLHAERARNLLDFEAGSDNVLRIRLRRIGGVMMMLLAASFYCAYAFSNDLIVIFCMLAVVILLSGILFLAWVDIRLTRKMRDSLKRKSES